MNKYYKKLISLLVIILATQNTLVGQVTIGSDNSPAAGALLQLKEDEGNGINSKKGLNMPRVTMTTTTPLVGQLAQSIGSSGTWNEADHIGLVVYNTNKCVNSTGMDDGLYVWNGTQWKIMPHPTTSSEVQSFTDTRDNEVYLYRSFGNEAGIWMLENMRYIDNSFTASAGSSSPTDRLYTYPNANPATPDTKPSTWERRQGLIYSYAAATLGVQDGLNVNQAEGQGTQGPATPIQGICPAGWHIPSDSEWNQLEKEIYNNPQKYSSYTSPGQFNPTSWNDTWNTTYSSRGSGNENGHGLAMQSPCQLPGASGITSGTSLPTSQGGFNVLLAGRANGGSVTYYGNYANFWCSSVSGSDNAWFRFLNRLPLGANYPPQQIERASTSRQYLFSVRCKKD